MLKIFEGHSNNIDREGLCKFAPVLRVQAESVLLQLCLDILPRTTIFTIDRRFHDHPDSILIWSVRNLHYNIAVHGIYANVL